MSRRNCSICGKPGHNKRTCPAQSTSQLVSLISSGSETQTDNELQEPKRVPNTPSPKKTPVEATPKKANAKTPPEAKEIMQLLNSDKKMLEEMTADFKFDPSNSSAEEPKQETKKQKAVQQRENQSKKTQRSNPQSEIFEG